VFLAFIGAKRESLDRRSGRSRRRFSAGRAERKSQVVAASREKMRGYYLDDGDI